MTSGLTLTHRCDITEIFVLLDGSRDGDHEQQDPGYSDLCKHLEVDTVPPLPPQRECTRGEHPRVQTRAHEDVVDQVARHPHRFPAVMTRDGEGVDEDGEEEGEDDGPRHEFPEMLDEVRQTENARHVENAGENDGRVERGEGVAVVHQRLVVERGDGQACEVKRSS